MGFIKLILASFVVGFFGACSYSVAHRPFVATSYEPVLIEKKGDANACLGLRPIKYGYGDLTIAPFDHLGLRVNAGGTYGLSNLSGSAFYFQKLNKINWFAGALYNFQSNQIQRHEGFTGTSFRDFNYSCMYHSGGVVFGLSLKDKKNRSHHFIFKSQYNFVSSYYYDFQRYDRYTYSINEQLNYKIPDFYSIEPSYSLVVNRKKNRQLKFQVSGVFAQKTLKHHYFYNWIAPYTGGNQISEAISFHPVIFPINFSICLIFSSKKATE